MTGCCRYEQGRSPSIAKVLTLLLMPFFLPLPLLACC